MELYEKHFQLIIKLEKDSMKKTVIDQINYFGLSRTPFFLITDFLGKSVILHTIDSLPNNIHFQFPNFRTKYQDLSLIIPKITTILPLSLDSYKDKFMKFQQYLHRGDTYLANLTVSTPININSNLRSFYSHSKAPYKVLVDNKFTLFSPEKFISIKDNIISTNPMKGTIDGAIPNGEAIILSSPKEAAEHATIVDLLRNDLSIVSKNVTVNRYRYCEKIKRESSDLIQVSSEISGELTDNWHEKLGNIISKLLPAGSVSGAPKNRTTEIISDTEKEERGFYTGISLFYDGECVDSCVNIRFIEQVDNHYFYRSGGGITAQSNLNDEYQEIIEKIYVPIY